jgi:hypothetical protein
VRGGILRGDVLRIKEREGDFAQNQRAASEGGPYNDKSGLLGGEGEIEIGQGGDHGGFCAEDEFAKRGFEERGVVRGGKFGVGPAAFGADGESGR